MWEQPPGAAGRAGTSQGIREPAACTPAKCDATASVGGARDFFAGGSVQVAARVGPRRALRTARHVGLPGRGRVQRDRAARVVLALVLDPAAVAPRDLHAADRRVAAVV